MLFDARTRRAPKCLSSPIFLRQPSALILAGGSLALSISFLAAGALRAAKPQAAGQASAGQTTTSSKTIQFDRDVMPTLQSSCVPCHGPEKHEGQLRLDSEEAILRGGVSGKVIIPGTGQETLLGKRLLGVAGAPPMPLGGDPLSAEKIALIRAWIEQGSFTSAPPPHDFPAVVKSPASHPLATSGSVVFASQIRPILAARCYPCHGPDVHQNGLRLDSIEAILPARHTG